jgi:A/G-specific adenine glycosylase
MEITKAQRVYFTRELMRWHEEENDRSLPWKQEKDPYKIWLSEIILQQTRAEQGLPYYLNFTEKYPTVEQLARAEDEEVFRLWQGLGYYNRCKNLLASARFIHTERNNHFPDTYPDLLALKGIGPYTAAAIASFAYGLLHAVVDGNVNRVIARYFGIDIPFDTTEGKKVFQELAQELLDKSDSAGYNQAIMDHGATVCTPANPACGECPLRKKCFAYNQGAMAALPVKSKKLVVKKRFFHYLVLTHSGKLWIRKRTKKDIWQNLFEPLLIENYEALDATTILAQPAFQALKLNGKAQYEGALTQRLTHQLIETRFFSMEVKRPVLMAGKEGEWVVFGQLKKYPFPRTLVSFLEKNLYF